MSTAASPVRAPAWPLSRTAIALWVTQGVVASVVLGVGAAVVVLVIPASVGDSSRSRQYPKPGPFP